MSAMVMPNPGDGVQVNRLNGAFTAGQAQVVAIAAIDGTGADYPAAIYQSDLTQGPAASWHPQGSLCDEAPTVGSPTQSTKQQRNGGATWRAKDGNQGEVTGILVIDAGAAIDINEARVFQMFSDGKTTGIRLSVHTEFGATPPARTDAGWQTLTGGFVAVGAGSDPRGDGSLVEDPTVIPISPARSTRYLRVEVKNDGTHGNPGYIELRCVKLFYAAPGPVAAAWNKIGEHISRIIGGGDSLYVNDSAGNLLRYDGSPGSFTQIGGPSFQVVAGAGFVASIAPDQSQILRWDGASWTQIGGPSNGLLASGPDLYSIDRPSGDLYAYHGQPGQWTRIGGPGYMFAAGRGFVVGISPDMNQVWIWRNGSWTQIGGAAREVATCGQDIYMLGPGAGEVYRFDGDPSAWTRVGDAPCFLRGGDSGIVVIMGNQQDVRCHSRGGGWLALGSPGLSTDAAIVGSKIYSAGPTSTSNVRCLYEWSEPLPGEQLTPWPAGVYVPDGTRIAIRMRCALSELREERYWDQGKSASMWTPTYTPWVKWLGLGDDNRTMVATDTTFGPRNIFTVAMFRAARAIPAEWGDPWFCMKASNGVYLRGSSLSSSDPAGAGLFMRQGDCFREACTFWGEAQRFLDETFQSGRLFAFANCASITGGGGNFEFARTDYGSQTYESGFVDFFIVS